MILILNNIYLGDLILKSSTYDDFVHLCLSLVSIASVGVTPRTKQLGVTPRTPLFEGKNPENQKTKISIKKGRLLLVNDQGFSQIRPT